MAIKSTLDAHTRRVLNCIGERWETFEEIKTKYSKLYPPTFALRLLGKQESISIRELRVILTFLWKEELIVKEVTSYTDIPLEKETPVYRLSDRGRMQKK